MSVQTNNFTKCIEYVSTWNYIKIYARSIFFGIIFMFSTLAKWMWNPKTYFLLQKRDRPPPILVDNSLGQHCYAKLNGVKFHYVENGLKNKTVMLMLHGFPDCWISWRHQIPVFSQHFKVIALDLKGFGDSDKPLFRRRYRIKVLLNELCEFIKAQGVSSCIVLGHDLGALLGWFLLYSYPDLVKKFVAISCPHPNLFWETLPNQGLFNIRWLHFCQLPYFPEMDVQKEDLSAISQSFEHINSNGSNGKTNIMEAYKYSFSRREDWGGPINYYRNLPFVRLRVPPENEENSWDNEPWKGGQMLLISGSQDSRISLESMICSTELLPPDAQYKVRAITGAGHFPHQENPDVVNNYILDFLHVPHGSPEKIAYVNGEGLPKRLVSRVLESSWVSSTVRYGNQVLDAAKKGAAGVVLSQDENYGGVTAKLGSNELIHGGNR